MVRTWFEANFLDDEGSRGFSGITQREKDFAAGRRSGISPVENWYRAIESVKNHGRKISATADRINDIFNPLRS